jgi:hypothetical protein
MKVSGRNNRTRVPAMSASAIDPKHRGDDLKPDA